MKKLPHRRTYPKDGGPMERPSDIPLEDRIENDQQQANNAQPGQNAKPGEEKENWFRRNLKLKNCKRFVLDDPNYKTKEKRLYLCTCGRRYDNHYPLRIQTSAEIPAKRPWNLDNDTTEYKTNAFGQILFGGHSQKTANYVRLSVGTSMPKVEELLFKQWKMNAPKFVVCVLGGEQNLEQKHKVNDIFSEGLVKACTSKFSEGWIVTGGAYTGVMDGVRDALSKNMVRPTMIGITPWGNVANRYKLTDRLGKGNWPAKHLVIPHPQKFDYSLDMNHSHFLLVDDGTINQKVDGIHQFRFKFTKMLKTHLGPQVPFINVIFKGGLGAIKTVAMSVQQSKKSELERVASVFVKYSGGAADILAMAYEASLDKNNYAKALPDIKNLISETFPDKNTKEILDLVAVCVSVRELVSVFDPTKRGVEAQLDKVILNAPIQAGAFGDFRKLELALSWNRVDLAKNIFSQSKTPISQREFGTLFTQAMHLNRPKFMELFQDNGFDLSMYLDVLNLETLYNKAHRESPAKRLMKFIRTESKILDVIINTANGLKILCCKVDEDDWHREYDLLDVARLIRRLLGQNYKSLYDEQVVEDRRFSGEKPSVDEDIPDYGDTDVVVRPDFEEPIRELFIWAILNDKPDVVRSLWGSLNDPIAGALLAVKLWKSMAEDSIFDDATFKRKFRSLADEFEQKAKGLLDTCYEYELEEIMLKEADEKKTDYLLIKSRQNYGNATCLQLAVDADCMDFMAHPAVQSLLDRIWRGKLSVDNEWWRVLSCVICPSPLLMYALLMFREDENVNSRGTKNRDEDESMLKKNQRGRLDIYDLGRKLGFWERTYYFFTAPIVVFAYNIISFAIFLLLFSYIVLCNYGPSISIPEMVLIAWVGTFLAEEIRQFLRHGLGYISSMGNWSDISAILTFGVSLGLRFIADTFQWPLYIACLSLVLFYLRLLHIFSVFKQLGPLLIMIRKMTVDLIFFMFFIAVFFWAYGITYHAIMYPNSPFTFQLLFAVYRASYWPMFGEVQTFLDGEIEVNNCTMDPVTGQLKDCSTAHMIAPILLGVYILFITVLMFNLLIALFSYRFEQMYPQTNELWCFQRYSLIREYHERPRAPPPLIILFHLVQLIVVIFKLCVRICCCCGKKSRLQNDILKYTFPWDRPIHIVFKTGEESLEKELSSWECLNAESFNTKEAEKEDPALTWQGKVDNLAAKLETLTLIVKKLDLDERARGALEQWKRVARLKKRDTAFGTTTVALSAESSGSDKSAADKRELVGQEDETTEL